MAAGITQQDKTVPGAAYEIVNKVAGDASYPAGGYVLTAALLGHNVKIARFRAPTPLNAASMAVYPVLIPTFGTGTAANFIVSLALRLIVAATGVELATAASAAAYSFLVTTEGA